MPATLLYFYLFLDSSQNTENSLAELGDLGNLLIGSFVTAVVIAIAFTFVRLRLRAKKPPRAEFISIKSPQITQIKPINKD